MRRYGLFVGIDKYKNGISRLHCAVNDARELSYAFNRTGYSVKLLTNEECDSNTISKAVGSMLAELQAGDIFVFYFSGHGREVEGMHHLVCANAHAEPRLHSLDAFPLSTLIELTNKVSGLNRFFILDCCRSNILADRAGYFSCNASRDIALEAAVSRAEKKRGFIPPLILNSCSTGEQAFEDEKTGHGYFTNVLLKVIKDDRIRNFHRFQSSLKISGTPRPQNISWNGSFACWDQVSLFKGWENTDLSDEEQQRDQKYQFDSRKDEFYELVGENGGVCSHEVTRILDAAKRAEDQNDFAVAKNYYDRAISQYLSDLKADAAEKQKIAQEEEAKRKEQEEKAKRKEQEEKAKRTAAEEERRKRARIDQKALEKAKAQNIVFSDLDQTLVRCPQHVAVCRIPKGVTAVGPGAFAGCENLKEVIFPKTVKRIDDGAFRDCASLLEIKLPKNLDKLGKRAFANCCSLRKVTIAHGLTDIADEAFEGCTDLVEIKLPQSVGRIGKKAFAECEKIQRLSFPWGLVWIDKCAFENCKSLKKVIFPASLKQVSHEAFACCESLKRIRFPERIEILEDDLLRDCDSLYHVSMPANFSWRFFDILGISEFTFEENRKSFARKTAVKTAQIFIAVPLLLFAAYWFITGKFFTFPAALVRMIPTDWLGGALQPDIAVSLIFLGICIIDFALIAIIFKIAAGNRES